MMVNTRTEKQNAILDEALALISEHGFHGAPISAIAKQANVGAGTIYRYYKTKDELIKDLYLREKQAVMSYIMDGCGPQYSVKENFRRIWYNILSAQSSYDVRSRFLDQFYNSPFNEMVTPEERTEMLAEAQALFDRGVKEGVLREDTIEVCGPVFMGTVSYLAHLVKCGGLEMSDDLSEKAFNTCWRAVAT